MISAGGKKSNAYRKLLFSNKCSLKSHFDQVRGLHFLPNIDSLVSASEDTTLKVWDVNKFSSLKSIEGVMNFEPYMTIRENFSPIFSLTGPGPNSFQELQNCVISGSKDGDIKAWKILPSN